MQAVCSQNASRWQPRGIIYYRKTVVRKNNMFSNFFIVTFVISSFKTELLVFRCSQFSQLMPIFYITRWLYSEHKDEQHNWFINSTDGRLRWARCVSGFRRVIVSEKRLWILDSAPSHWRFVVTMIGICFSVVL